MSAPYRVSWWRVAWRLLWVLPAYAGLTVYCLALWAGWGENPVETWKDLA